MRVFFAMNNSFKELKAHIINPIIEIIYQTFNFSYIDKIPQCFSLQKQLN